MTLQPQTVTAPNPPVQTRMTCECPNCHQHVSLNAIMLNGKKCVLCVATVPDD